MADNNLMRFQGLLKQLFQFDTADLDFGIYRILNVKRREIDGFISERLPVIVDAAFEGYAAADQAVIVERMDQIRQALSGAFDESGNIKSPFDQLDQGKEYKSLQDKLSAFNIADSLKSRVYNDLYTFFARYFDDGDFISKRRRGRDETYSVPYNGEEVLLYWANHDQYYIKSGERLASYRFQVDGGHVAVEIRSADIVHDDVKATKRFFVLAQSEAVKWDEAQKTLVVNFEHRLLTDEEGTKYGTQKQQEKLNTDALNSILEQVSEPMLKVALAKQTESGQPILLKHLTQFARQNTSDFFIHKDLRKFLLRELDFYLKNEALVIDELLGGNAIDFNLHIQRARVLREAASKVITFLAQVEDFQKKLFNKRKFVLCTDYTMTLDHVPQAYWPEILANTAQIQDWDKTYNLEKIKESDGMFKTLDDEFLKRHQSLMIDTRFFTDDFMWRLLAELTATHDLDALVNGLLFDAENYQALQLLRTKYAGQIKCCYIHYPCTFFGQP